MVFKRMLRAMGVGGPSVETVLANPNCRPGGYLEGQVHVIGGEHAVDIEYVAVGLMTRVEMESGDSEYNTDQEFQLGAGYHTLQAKIALGSGGMTGKGFGAGTQTQLDFLPEKHTDFIFTVIGEELGFVGCVALLAICAAIMAVGVSIAMSSRHQFGRLAAMGVCAMFAFYVFINVAMVMGLIPVVGVPLPLVSYGGTAMLAVMTAFGLVLNVHLNQDEELPRGGGGR